MSLLDRNPNLSPMAKVRFRGEPGTRVAHQLGAEECVHVFADQPLQIDPDSEPECLNVIDRFAEYAHVPITSQPEKAKEPAA